MASASTVITESWQPSTTPTAPASSVTPPHVDTINLPTTATTMSSIRRKPKVTYQSPSVHLRKDLRIEGPSTSSFTQALSLKIASSSSSSPKAKPTPALESISTEVDQVGAKLAVRRKKYTMGPPLPLYHPLGRLALSLPELDPASLGFAAPLTIDDSSRRSSARARRPAAKLREADEEAESVAYTSTATITPDTIAKEKSTPRKKRGSGTAGGGKRKRKEVDDGDATYPAKRTRNPRGARDAGSPTEPVVPEVTTATAAGETSEEKEKKPERRVTRARPAAKRRDSSASEATVTSVSVSVVAATTRGRAKSDETMDAEMTSVRGEADAGASADKRSREVTEKETTAQKEEGELSESSTATKAKD